MRARAASCLRTVVLAATLGGLGACQTAGTQSVVVSSAEAPQGSNGMDGDIRRILTQGGLNAASPGSLQTGKMPADVQQAVAALQGGQAAPVPFGGAAGVSPVGVQGLPQSSASSIAMLPTAAGVPPANALAMAPAPPTATPFPTPGVQPPLLAALAQTQAAHARTSRRAYAAPAPRLAPAPVPDKAPATVLALAPAPAGVAPAAPPAPPKAVEPPPPRRF